MICNAAVEYMILLLLLAIRSEYGLLNTVVMLSKCS